MAQKMFPPELLYRYPHMMPAEVPLWERFLQEHRTEYEAFQYDVHVGVGQIPGPETSEYIRKMAASVSKKRIDAIGFKEDQIHIFEVKPEAGLSAVGQLLAYQVLYPQTFPTEKEILLNLVTDFLTEDTKTSLKAYNINYYIV